MLRYRLIALVYFLALVPAFMLAGNPDNSGYFHWSTFWQFELIVPTIAAAVILVLGWVVNPNPGPQRH